MQEEVTDLVRLLLERTEMLVDVCDEWLLPDTLGILLVRALQRLLPAISRSR